MGITIDDQKVKTLDSGQKYLEISGVDHQNNPFCDGLLQGDKMRFVVELDDNVKIETVITPDFNQPEFKAQDNWVILERVLTGNIVGTEKKSILTRDPVYSAIMIISSLIIGVTGLVLSLWLIREGLRG